MKPTWKDLQESWKDATWTGDDTAGVLLVLFIVILLWGVGK